MARYRQLLTFPLVRRVVLCALIGRIPIAAQSLAILLLIHERTGSYAVAGAVSAAYGLASGLTAPLQGRLIDSLGQTRVLLICAAGNPTLLAGMILASTHRPPAITLVACAAAAGALMPALSPAMRALWPHLATTADQLASAFALESVIVEFYFLCGPLLTAAVSATISPTAAVIVAGTMTLLGTLGFATSPPSRAWRPTAHKTSGLAGALASPGIRTITLVSLPVGLAIGSLGVTLPAFAATKHAAALGGVLLAALAIGSTTGGLLYGTRDFTRPTARRWLELNILLATGFIPLTIVTGLPLMALACIVAGLAFAPLISTSWTLIERLAPIGTLTEANTWQQTAIAIGTATGTISAGLIVQHASINIALITPCAAVAIGATIAIARQRTVSSAPTTPDAEPFRLAPAANPLGRHVTTTSPVPQILAEEQG